MKIVLTVQLQQDNGTPVLTGTQTKLNFTSADCPLVRGYLIGDSVANLIKIMGWLADGEFTLNGTPTLTISQL